MIKVLLRYLMPLSVLLVSGYCQLAASLDQDITFGTLLEDFSASTPVHFGSAHPDVAANLYSSSSDTGKKAIVEVAKIVEEKEENESDPFIKYVTRCYCVIPLFDAHRADYFGHFMKERLSSYRHFSYFSSLPSRYLLVRVFRL